MLNSVAGGKSHKVNIVFENNLRRQAGYSFAFMMILREE